MKITYLDIADAGKLVHVYNKHFVDVPHCYPVSPEEFEVGLRDPKNDRHCKELYSERIIAGEESGRLIGFAHIDLGEIKFSDRKRPGGLIHFLTYEAGYRLVGQAILEECEKHLRDLGAQQIWAFQNGCNYRFYHLDFGNLSDRMGHVYALFRMNGYEMNEGEIFMEEREYAAIEPVPPGEEVEIALERQTGRGVLPGLVVKAIRDGRQIGICDSGSAGDCCQASEAQNSFFIHWLGIEEEEQGKGWGCYLLQKTRWEMRKIGYKNAVISTDWRNYRGLLFYANYGYEVTDTVYGFVKQKDRDMPWYA
jgi:GNAT superfamily N-acetyltransferase